jgi:hypothetical protein
MTPESQSPWLFILFFITLIMPIISGFTLLGVGMGSDDPFVYSSMVQSSHLGIILILCGLHRPPRRNVALAETDIQVLNQRRSENTGKMLSVDFAFWILIWGFIVPYGIRPRVHRIASD